MIQLDFSSADTIQLLKFTGAIILSGAVSGLIAGLFGVGGGIITVPVLFAIFKLMGTPPGIAIHMAIATSLAVIVVTSKASMRAHKRRGAIDRKILGQWAIPVFIGSILGAIVAFRLSGHWLSLTFAIFTVFIAALMGLAPAKMRVAKHPPKGFMQIPVAGIIGFISALVGVGGGSLSVPTMVLCNVPIHRAVGTASAIGQLISFPATIVFLLLDPPPGIVPPGSVGFVNLLAFAVMAPITIFTAPLGARLAHHLPAAKLRRGFSIFLFLVAADMIWNVLF